MSVLQRVRLQCMRLENVQNMLLPDVREIRFAKTTTYQLPSCACRVADVLCLERTFAKLQKNISINATV